MIYDFFVPVEISIELIEYDLYILYFAVYEIKQL